MKKRQCLLGAIFLALILTSCSGAKGDSSSQPATSSQPTTSSSVSQKVVITVIGGTGSGEYRVGENVTISATVPEYKLFDYWKRDGVKVSENNPYTFQASKSETYEAVFKAKKGTLTVVNGTGSGEYDLNSDVTVEATPEAGETFLRWEIDSEIVSTSSVYTFKFIEDTTITAVMDGGNKMAQYTRTIYKTDSKFKILNLTDIQVTNNDNLDLTKHIIDYLVEQEEPDMITVLGDTLNDSPDYDCDVASKNVFDYIDAKNIPWAPIFGNHDNTEYTPTYVTKKSVGVPYLMDLFEDYDNCLFIEGPNDVLGKSNYLVNIVEQSTEELVETLVFLDSFTNGLDSTSVGFYQDAVDYAAELNGGTKVPTVVFSHIPVQEYKDEFNRTQANECHDAVGVLISSPLSTTGDTIFNSMKTNGNTKTMICGHDHENQYYTVKEGIKLAYAMKSSDGDNDAADYIHKHPLGGLMLTVDGENEDQLDYVGVDDISFTVKGGKDFDFHPQGLPYWKYSGAKLVFDVEFPKSGKIQFNLQGTNLMRSSIEYSKRIGCWNRLTGNVDLVATEGSAPSTDYGTLVQLEGNKYRYEVDLSTLNLNKSGGEEAFGDETARLIYFHQAKDAVGDFTFTNIHYEFEKIIETDQSDLANAVIGNIEDQSYSKGIPLKPTPSVTLDGETLKLGDDIIYTYENNTEVGTATLTIIPSGKGAHNYKGSVSKTFNIVGSEWRGDLFEKGYQHDFKELTIATDTLMFDVHFTSTGDNTMKFMIGDGWDSLFGYYGLKNNGTLEDNYSGVTVQTTADDYYRVTCVLSKLNKQNGSTPMPTTKVNKFYIHGSWGNNPKGYIDFDISEPPVVIRGESFSPTGKTISFPKLTYSDTILVDFRFTSGQDTHVNFMVGNGGNEWKNYFGYFKLKASGSLEEKYNGISVSKTEDGYFRLTIVLAELTKASTDGGPSPEDGFNLFFISDKWTTASGYVDFNPGVKPEKTTEFTMKGDSFVIANFTDIHVDNESLLDDDGTVGKTIKYGISNSKPDILVFSGDVAGSSTDLNYLCTYLDSFEIPYFFVMGNHDHELGYDTIANRLSQSKYGYIEKGSTTLGSEGNYTIKINDSDGNLVHGLILMDTGNKYTISDYSNVEYFTGTQVSGVKYGTFNGQTTYCDGTTGAGNVWDGIRGNQINWFEDTASELDCETTLICHAGFNEYVKAFEQYQDAVNKSDAAKIAQCAPIGECNMGEQVCGTVENTGLFEAIKSSGTKNVICGHDHLNDFSLMYQDVRLTYALKTGDGAYWKEGGTRSGYTELTIDELGLTSLNQIYFNPLLA